MNPWPKHPVIYEINWRLKDLVGDAQYDRDGNDLQSRGLYFYVPPWQNHIFTMTRFS